MQTGKERAGARVVETDSCTTDKQRVVGAREREREMRRETWMP